MGFGAYEGEDDDRLDAGHVRDCLKLWNWCCTCRSRRVVVSERNAMLVARAAALTSAHAGARLESSSGSSRRVGAWACGAGCGVWSDLIIRVDWPPGRAQKPRAPPLQTPPPHPHPHDSFIWLCCFFCRYPQSQSLDTPHLARCSETTTTTTPSHCEPAFTFD